jgi:hypothetical protein
MDFEEKPTPMLTFTDDGRGMALATLHRMLSFGYCDKVLQSAAYYLPFTAGQVEVDGHKPIGHYGNGCKLLAPGGR